ncbi:hypothetical protein SDC9_208673 [bioreactor metagenome]|uniref:Uncharacterized protein n=1 Tax=bioreactor metagenome TaxID=1076179 RepID=A0A645JCZ4_9ZZZZ
MGEAEGGQGAILHREIGQVAHQGHQFAAQYLHTVAHLDKFGVVGDVAAGGAEVNDRHRLGAERAEHMDMAHHIVPELLLLGGGGLEIDVVEVGPHLIELLAGDVQS